MKVPGSLLPDLNNTITKSVLDKMMDTAGARLNVRDLEMEVSGTELKITEPEVANEGMELMRESEVKNSARDCATGIGGR